MNSVEKLYDYVPSAWQSIILKDDIIKIQNNLLDKPIIKPELSLIFRCFNYFTPKDTNVIILAQDPYVMPNAANGLCLSYTSSGQVPKSLVNFIYRIMADFNCLDKLNIRYNTDLEFLAKQNVLLLNSILTVGNESNDHKYVGWEFVTNNVIKELSKNYVHIVFILLGSHSHTKEAFINNKCNHKIIKVSHPCSMSQNHENIKKGVTAFSSTPMFLECNNYLESCNKKKIDWISGLLNC